MFFKNIQVYRMTAGWDLGSDINAVLEAHAHEPIGASQEISVGWVPVQDDRFAYSVGGQLMLHFKTEVRKVPGSALKAKVKAACEQFQDQTGRKPCKKERREISDDTLLSLLPMVLPTAQQVRVWIDLANGWVVLNTGSQSLSDRIMTALVKALDKIQLQTLVLARSVGVVMTEWLAAQEGPIAFAIDRACELKANDESKAVVRYTNSTLDTDNLREHIRQGKVCTSLALTWNDRVSFVLTDQFRIKKIKFLDIIQTEREQNTVDEVAVFQSDFAILTGELAKMLADLVEAFGGEQKAEEDDDLFI